MDNIDNNLDFSLKYVIFLAQSIILEKEKISRHLLINEICQRSDTPLWGKINGKILDSLQITYPATSSEVGISRSKDIFFVSPIVDEDIAEV